MSKPSPASAAPGADGADDVAGVVLTASRLLVAISARSLASIEESLTLPQFRMLVVLDSRGPMNISRLGEHLDVIPSTAMRMVDRLVAAGMLEREASPASRRETLVHLTGAGRRTVGRATDRRRREIARVVERMPAEARANLVEALRAFNEAGDEPRADDGRPAEW
ncbi:MarR family transcriptional regulator [Mangrovactinospora gilvigrisea]|uniref:MarR family transcriptional regulator n=1 Tax=Mangrovactinospora gilvigrisea TaxID=1428644 RepID=A0A1J7C133_9ACTN|nr:MarR family transcriptional regulator [Mangrovactinospora gilvigrisea]OIV39441.1 MarR family transcriptional regulator [Mangrovactinospora gilvigrisea]